MSGLFPAAIKIGKMVCLVCFQLQSESGCFLCFQLHVCEVILENEGAIGHVTLEEFHLDLFPLDADLLSLEMPSLFRSFYLVGLCFLLDFTLVRKF